MKNLQRYVKKLFVLLTTISTTVAQGNVVGSDTQNFNPTTSGLDFVTVHSSETLEPGYFNLGLFVNKAVNTLPFFEDSPQGRGKYSDALIGADINIGIGLLPGWDIGLSVPQVLHQEVESDGFRGQFSENGNTEIRFNTKLRLWGTSDYGVALVGTSNVNRIKDNPYTGKDSGPTHTAELVADTTISNVALGINGGYRWRDSGEKVDADSPIEPLEDQIIASAAASYLFNPIDTKLIFEIFGSRPANAETENSDRLASTAEALLGIKHDFTTNFAGHFGGGTELLHGRGSPDWRIYAGLNWSVGPTFSKPKARNVAKGKPDAFAGPPKAVEKIVIHDVLFEFDSDSKVLQGANATLSKLAKYVLLKPSYSKLIIEGHTDSVGPASYNQGLSVRRAQTIRKWLVDRFALDGNKVIATGKGESKPIANNGNYQGRQLNRRVEFTIYRTK